MEVFYRSKRKLIGIVFLITVIELVSIRSFSQNIERVKATLDTLCSPEFAGRGYVNEGDKKAAEFIAKAFNRAGLKSISGDGYFQYFEFPINTFPREVNLQIDGRKMQLGKDFIVSSGSSSGSGTSSIYVLDTLVFSNSAAQREFLKRKSAKTVLVYRQTDLHKISKLPQQYQEKFSSFDQYIELIEKKLTASVSPLQNSKPTFHVLQERFPEGAKKAQFKVDAVHLERYTSQNVVGIIPGTENIDSAIVITAHYDHLGKMGEIYFPGANDNASGVTMLLELASYFAANPLKYTLVFIAFSAEEAGLIGSHHFTQNPLYSLEKMKFLLNLDMVGTGDDGITVVNGAVHEKEFDLLKGINEEKRYLPQIKKRGEAANSDHYFFHKKGVKSFFVYALGGTTAYHDVDDKSETLPLTRYKEIFGLLGEFLKKL